MVEHRHVHTVDVDAGVGWRRAPDRQETDPERRSRDAWEVLDGLQRVTLGAGDVLDLRGGERLLDRLDDGALPAHGRRVPLLHVDEQAELGGLPFVQRDRDVDGEKRRSTQRQLVLAHRERGERKSSLLVGDGPPLVPRRDGDQRDRARDSHAITAPAHHPCERDGGGVRRLHPIWGRRRGWTQIGLEHEPIAIRNSHRDRMSVGLLPARKQIGEPPRRPPDRAPRPLRPRLAWPPRPRRPCRSRRRRARGRPPPRAARPAPRGGPPPRNERDAVA